MAHASWGRQVASSKRRDENRRPSTCGVCYNGFLTAVAHRARRVPSISQNGVEGKGWGIGVGVGTPAQSPRLGQSILDAGTNVFIDVPVWAVDVGEL